MDSVSKVYGTGEAAVPALNNVSIGIHPGTFTAVMGPSGSGKSTFLHCAAGLDLPSAGRVWLGGIELSGLSQANLTEVRRAKVGFVFQAYNLVASLTVEENITLPLRLAGKSARKDFVREVAAAVGLAEYLKRRPSELSGGQQQRVAIARALVVRPEVVFADEPTGALDSRSGRQVLRLLREVVDMMGQTVVMVTHDPVAASTADAVLFLADGRLVAKADRPSPQQIADRMTNLGEW
ncbi:ABC transporter ATP-binding protein [Actinosynnema sp. ALI-1.44]|uniref:ABC transporter ATP-binding protein n=1 Tax=Actinosynnema sp. ALI-1.44 TaxID=1933779 RepID=UPI001EDBBE45|nr:ABC transporter ATP-binding protein [Actinosynnema sp. ALI-1.44]